MTKTLFVFYRRVISPDTGLLRAWFPFGCCRFYPSCSRYAEDSIVERGLLQALPLIVWRLLRCNPWSQGGVDLPL